MARLLAFFSILGWVFGGIALGADETYELKLYQSKKGDRRFHETSEEESSTSVIVVMGKSMETKTLSASKVRYTEEILEHKAGDRKPTKLTRAYEVSEKTEKGATTKAAYAGETVLIEKRGDKFEFSVKGKALTETEAGKLATFNGKSGDFDKQDMMPERPIKVGESWQLPAEKLEKLFKGFGAEGMTLDLKKSSIGGKLLKAYKKDGAQFGVFDLTSTIAINGMVIDGKPAEIKPGSKMVFELTMDTCIDGTVDSEEIKGAQLLEIEMGLPEKITLRMSNKSTGSESTRAVKK